MEFYKKFEDLRQHWSELIGLRFQWVREDDADLKAGLKAVFDLRSVKFEKELKEFSDFLIELKAKYSDEYYDEWVEAQKKQKEDLEKLKETVSETK